MRPFLLYSFVLMLHFAAMALGVLERRLVFTPLVTAVVTFIHLAMWTMAYLGLAPELFGSALAIYLVFLVITLITAFVPSLIGIGLTLTGVIYYYFSSRGSADDMLEEIGTSTLIPVAAVISLALFIFFMVLWLYQVRGNTSLSHPSGKIEKG